MNPLLPSHFCVPDAEARVYGGRVYLYGSLDIGGDTSYCSDRYRVFSSADLEQWTNHGQSFALSGAHEHNSSRLYAPDAIEHNGQHLLFYCGNTGSEGVAFSDSPAGPFSDARPVIGADGDGIDPAILEDDDGQLYFFWGQFTLRGGRLTDQCELEMSTVETSLLTEDEHGFHEGACIRKIGDTYYLVYTDISRGRPTCLSYATAESPLGPYEKRGVIIDNTGCDPETWNNHGSIALFDGQWYVFYHRSSQGSRFNRRVCAETIEVAPDGSIAEVKMTTRGPGAPIPAAEPLAAWRACELHGRLSTRRTGWHRDPDRDDEILAYGRSRDRAVFRSLSFRGTERSVELTVSSAGVGGTLSVRLDHPVGVTVAEIAVPDTGGWDEFEPVTVPLRVTITGVHELHVVFTGTTGRVADLKEIRFA